MLQKEFCGNGSFHISFTYSKRVRELVWWPACAAGRCGHGKPLGTLIFSRRTAALSLQGGAFFVAVIIFVSVVGYATNSSDVVLSSLANLAFICGLAVVGVVVLRAIWRAIVRAIPRATGLWSSAVAHLQSQITLLRFYSRTAANAGDEALVQESLNPNFDPR